MAEAENPRGIVFNIQRCSLQDGPGIRSTVFLKGCPLRCAWCHNPESWAIKPELSYNGSKCVRCGLCASICPQKVHEVAGGSHTVRHKDCTACGLCVEKCLAGALEIIGRPMDLDDVIEEVLRDKPFYDSSGGGITLSGGEPFMQSEFTMALLKKSKKAGLHVCIETSGFARQQLIKESMEYVDIYLFDYKATDPQKHTDFTGVSNEVIIANLQFLLENQARVILRCPLIEGVNDSPGHLEGIASLYRQYQHLAGLEVMAYHNMGKDKGIRVGIDKEKMLEQPLTPEAVKSGWIDKLKSLGCSIAKIG